MEWYARRGQRAFNFDICRCCEPGGSVRISKERPEVAETSCRGRSPMILNIGGCAQKKPVFARSSLVIQNQEVRCWRSPIDTSRSQRVPMSECERLGNRRQPRRYAAVVLPGGNDGFESASPVTLRLMSLRQYLGRAWPTPCRLSYADGAAGSASFPRSLCRRPLAYNASQCPRLASRAPASWCRGS
jgi:hypothetical protein